METVTVTASASHGLGMSTIAWLAIGVLVLAAVAWQARVHLARHRG